MKKHICKIISVLLSFAVALCVIGAFDAREPTIAIAETEDVKTADVFLIAGQSNAAGSTSVTATPSFSVQPFTPTHNVLYYGETHRTTSGTGTGRRISDLRPVQHGCGFTDNHVGFELGLAQYLNECEEYAGENKKAVIFKSAAGGTSVMPDGNYNNFGNWYPRSLWETDYEKKDYYNKVGLQYRAFMDTFVDAVAAMKEKGFKKITIKGLFWMQGESDRNRPDEYVEVCKTLFEDFRTDLSGITGEDYSELPIYVGEISKTFGSADQSSVDLNMGLISAQYSIAAQMKNVFVVKLRDYDINVIKDNQNVVVGSDSAHWNYLDVIAIGKDFAQKYADTYGIIDCYVNVVVADDEQNSAAMKKCKINFTGEYGPNFGKNVSYVDFEISLVSSYGINSVSADNANVTLAETVYEENSVSPILKYRIDNLPDSDVVLNIDFKKNKSYRVTITCNDNTYGRTPNVKGILPAYSGNRYIVKTYPEYNGAVEKLIINGVTVNGRMGVSDYVFENWEEDFDAMNHKGLEVEIVYGEYNAVSEKLNGNDNKSNDENGGCSCRSAANVSDLLSLFAALSVALLVFRKRLL